MRKKSFLKKLLNFLSQFNTGQQNLIFFVILLLLTFLTYFELLQNTFLADDYAIIHQVSSGGNYLRAGAFFRPVVLFIWKQFYNLFQYQAFYYYLFTLIIIAMIGISIRLLILTLNYFLCANNFSMRHSKLWAHVSLLSPVIFIVHFRKTEAVAWLSDWYYLFAGLFSLLSIISYMYYKIKSNQKVFLGLSIISYTLALFSHEQAFPVVFLFLILDWSARKNGKNTERSTIHFFKNNGQAFFYFGILISYFVIRYYLIGGIGGYSHISLRDYFNLKKIHHFLGLIIPPLHFSSIAQYIIPVIIIVLGQIVALVYGFSGLFKKNNIKSKIQENFEILFYFLSAAIFLFPILSMHIPFTGILQERILFMSIIFLSIILSFGFLSIVKKSQHKALIWSGVALFCITSLLYTKLILHNTYIPASKIQRDFINSSLKSAVLKTKKTKFIILYPDNYQHAYILRNATHVLPLSKIFESQDVHFLGMSYIRSTKNNVIFYEKKKDFIILEVKNLTFNIPEITGQGYKLFSANYILSIQFSSISNVKVLIYNLERKDFDVYTF